MASSGVCPAVDCLLLQPGQYVAPPVADCPAHPEAARPGAQVSPVALRRHGSSKEGGDFVDGQQFVVELDGVVGVGRDVLFEGWGDARSRIDVGALVPTLTRCPGTRQC